RWQWDDIARSVRIFVERVRRDPAAHQHHGHAGTGMRRAAGEIEALEIGRAVAGFEGTEEFSMARQTVDRAVEHMVTIMNVLRRERALEHDALFEVWHLAGGFELIEDHLRSEEHTSELQSREKLVCR